MEDINVITNTKIIYIFIFHNNNRRGIYKICMIQIAICAICALATHHTFCGGESLLVAVFRLGRLFEYGKALDRVRERVGSQVVHAHPSPNRGDRNIKRKHKQHKKRKSQKYKKTTHKGEGGENRYYIHIILIAIYVIL